MTRNVDIHSSVPSPKSHTYYPNIVAFWGGEILGVGYQHEWNVFSGTQVEKYIPNFEKKRLFKLDWTSSVRKFSGAMCF